MATWELVTDTGSGYGGTANDHHEERVLGTLNTQLGMRAYNRVADEGTLSFEVDNHDRRYSPEHASSPIYNVFVPGVFIRLRWFDGTATYYTMWTGQIDTIEPQPFQYATQLATVNCIGWKKQLDNFEFYTEVWFDTAAYFAVWDAWNALTDPVFFPLVNLSRGNPSRTYVVMGDNAQSTRLRGPTNAYQYIQNITDGEAGWFFIDRDGNATHGRWDYWSPNPAGAYDLGEIASELNYVSSSKYHYNNIEAIYYPRDWGLSASDILWESFEDFELAAGEAVTFKAVYQIGTLGTNGAVVTPTGANFVFTGGTTTIAIDAKSKAAIVTLTNTDTVPSTVTKIIIRGQTVDGDNGVRVIVKDAAAEALYGRKTKTLDLRIMGTLAEATARADYELYRLRYLGGIVSSVTFRRALVVAEWTSGPLSFSIGEVVRVRDTQVDHDENYIIVGESISINPNEPALYALTWNLMPVLADNYWLIDVSGRTEIDDTTIIGY